MVVVTVVDPGANLMLVPCMLLAYLPGTSALISGPEMHTYMHMRGSSDGWPDLV